jgi:aspartyl aminopeptidase
VNENFTFNKETEFVPILGLSAEKLNQKGTENDSEQSFNSDKHQPTLLSLLSNELSVAPEHIVDMELSLYDCQPATLGNFFN